MTKTTIEALREKVAGLREAIIDWSDNMRNEAMSDLLCRADELEAALSQGEVCREELMSLGPSYRLNDALNPQTHHPEAQQPEAVAFRLCLDAHDFNTKWTAGVIEPSDEQKLKGAGFRVERAYAYTAPPKPAETERCVHGCELATATCGCRRPTTPTHDGGGVEVAENCTCSPIQAAHGHHFGCPALTPATPQGATDGR